MSAVSPLQEKIAKRKEINDGIEVETKGLKFGEVTCTFSRLGLGLSKQFCKMRFIRRLKAPYAGLQAC